jgi:hypothetical protein
VPRRGWLVAITTITIMITTHGTIMTAATGMTITIMIMTIGDRVGMNE